jgi:ubiquinol-cytochrome c reductase iron-sulfur subunit
MPRDTTRRPIGRTASIELVIGLSFLASCAAAVALVVVYWLGGQVQAEGALLAVVLGSLALGIGLWASHLMPVGERVEQRHPLSSPPAEREQLREDFDRGESYLTRRATLLKLLGLAGAGLVAVVALPIRSLGPRPGDRLRRTGWREGARVVDQNGRPVHVDDLDVGAILTVFPESDDDPESSQTVLIRLEPHELQVRPGREDWSPEGYVAFSKLCTHLACPVGLYDATTHQLLCPCHQSLFDVLDGARPVFGPATRSLPQLPLRIEPDGSLVARSDYTEPVGPGFWDR